MLLVFAELDRLGPGEYPVRVELTRRAGDVWTYGLVVQRYLGPEAAPGPVGREDSIAELKLELIGGSNAWVAIGARDLGDLDVPIVDSFAAARFAQRVADTADALALAPAVAETLGIADGQRAAAAELAAAVPDDDDGGIRRGYDEPDEDDPDPPRPAIIGASPEEVQRRIEEARAAARNDETIGPDVQGGPLDDLPF